MQFEPGDKPNLHPELKPSYAEKQKDLRPQSRARVQDDILYSARARRQKALVPLVETRYESRAKDRNVCPAKSPFRVIHHRQSGSPGAKKQKTQNRVTDDVPALANIEMPVLKAEPVHGEEEMQHRIQNPAGIVR